MGDPTICDDLRSIAEAWRRLRGAFGGLKLRLTWAISDLLRPFRTARIRRRLAREAPVANECEAAPSSSPPRPWPIPFSGDGVDTTKRTVVEELADLASVLGSAHDRRALRRAAQRIVDLEEVLVQEGIARRRPGERVGQLIVEHLLCDELKRIARELDDRRDREVLDHAALRLFDLEHRAGHLAPAPPGREKRLEDALLEIREILEANVLSDPDHGGDVDLDQLQSRDCPAIADLISDALRVRAE